MAAAAPPVTEFPRAIGRVATRQLAAAGYVRFDQLAGASRATLLSIHGVGPKAIGVLAEELTRRGLAFAGD